VAFRARARARLIESIQAEALASRPTASPWQRLARSILRPALAPVAALWLLFSATGVWTASASALPGTPLYPAKRAAEAVELFTAITPAQRAQVELGIASARLQEAEAEAQAGNSAEVVALLASSDHELALARSSGASGSEVNAPVQGNASAPTVVDGNPPTAPATRPSATVALRRGDVTSPADGGDNLAVADLAVAPSATIASGTSGSLMTATDVPGPGDTATSIPRPATHAGVLPVETQSLRSVAPAVVLDRLLTVLLTQAARGDAVGAATSAQRYSAYLQWLSTHGYISPELVAAQRARLQQALAHAPAGTRAALQSALTADGGVNPTATPVLIGERAAAASGGLVSPPPVPAPRPNDPRQSSHRDRTDSPRTAQARHDSGLSSSAPAAVDLVHHVVRRGPTPPRTILRVVVARPAAAGSKGATRRRAAVASPSSSLAFPSGGGTVTRAAGATVDARLRASPPSPQTPTDAAGSTLPGSPNRPGPSSAQPSLNGSSGQTRQSPKDPGAGLTRPVPGAAGRSSP
jgi:hypothetical protein